MAASFAFGIAGKVLEKLGSAAYEGICSAYGVRKEFEMLKETLFSIKVVLLDAEENQARNPELGPWLQMVIYACYVVEDLIDEFEIQWLRKQVVERGTTGRKVRHFFSGSNPLAFRFRMGSKIKKVNESLNEVAAKKVKFCLTEKYETNVIHSEIWKLEQRETYSFVKASGVIGRDEAKEDIIVNFLMKPTDGEIIPVLPIFGIGGIGKTTLAQLVYYDEQVKKHFELRIWECVSENFDIKQLMIKIIESATGLECKGKTKEGLHKVLQDCLNGKRFFVVLDDIWNEDKKKWIELKDLLSVGAQGSKIVVTTRSRNVATITGTTDPYDLGLLSNKNCLSLFLKLAFNEGEEKQHPHLVRIGHEIVQNCKGVALAVKTLGGLLCSTREQHEWEHVRDSEIWELEQKENDILPALKLSYDHLPWYLKQCFAFCSVFPKDFVFNNVRLISMWMANGFLQTSNKNEEEEDIGNRYIHELWSISFFQQVEVQFVEDNGVLSTFKMHDLVHDLALSVAQNEVNSGNQRYTSGDVRHLRLDLSGENANSQLPNNLGRLQSLIFRSNEEAKAGSSESLIATCISRSKHLKVLHMEGCSLEQFPNNIRYLKRLRYLSAQGSRNIKKLPNSICNLRSLETLDLLGCEGIEELPKDMSYLFSLRTLIVTTKQTSLQGCGIEGLTSLRMLVFTGCENLKYLFEDMQRLRSLRKLVIMNCNNLISLPQGLKYLTALEALAIIYCEKLDLSMEVELGGKEDGSLRTLIIQGLPKVESLPQWIVLGSIKTLHHLFFAELENLSTLPPWFQHLKSLQKLEIIECPKLSSLPEGMQHLTALNELKIRRCPELAKRCMKETSKDWPKIARIPRRHLIDNSETSTTDDE